MQARVYRPRSYNIINTQKAIWVTRQTSGLAGTKLDIVGINPRNHETRLSNWAIERVAEIESGLSYAVTFQPPTSH